MKTIKNIYQSNEYPDVNGIIMAETKSHWLIDATCGGTKLVESNLKFIINKDTGYFIRIGWNHPMNYQSNYEEGWNIIKQFKRQYNSANREWYIYTFYGRCENDLKSYENPIIIDFLEKRFKSKESLKKALLSIKDEVGTFKDVGINNTWGGGITSAHTIKDLINKI